MPARRWWDGRVGWPPITETRRYWFDGFQWVRWRNGRPTRPGLSLRGAVCLLLSAAWLPVDAILLNAHDGNPALASEVVAAVVTGLGLLALPAGGLVLARDREPWRFRFLWLLGTAATLAGTGRPWSHFPMARVRTTPQAPA